MLDEIRYNTAYMIKYDSSNPEHDPKWSNFDKVLVVLTVAFLGLGFAANPGYFALAALTDTAALGRRMAEYNQQKKIYN